MMFQTGRWALALSLAVAVTMSLPTSAAEPRIPSHDWISELALGGSLATGNTQRNAFDVDAQAKYRAGRVEDHYKFKAELGRDGGVTTSQRWVVGYDTNIDIADGLFASSFVQYENDKFSGFQSEIEGGIGVGYRVLQTQSVKLSVNAGPGYRVGRLKKPLPSEKEIFARGTALLDWQMSENAKLTNELTISWDSERTKVEDTLAVTSKLIGSLSGRASVNVRYNTAPPRVTIKKTDTISKVALVYSF